MFVVAENSKGGEQVFLVEVEEGPPSVEEDDGDWTPESPDPLLNQELECFPTERRLKCQREGNRKTQKEKHKEENELETLDTYFRP